MSENPHGNRWFWQHQEQQKQGGQDHDPREEGLYQGLDEGQEAMSALQPPRRQRQRAQGRPVSAQGRHLR